MNKEQLLDILKSMKYPKEAFQKAFPGIPNFAAFVRDELENEVDLNLIENRIQKITNEHKKIIECIKREEAESKKKTMENLRLSRNRKLKDSDYTQLSDAPISSEVKKQYKKYRQHLRDLPYLIRVKAKLDYKVPTFEEWCDMKEIKIIKG